MLVMQAKIWMLRVRFECLVLALTLLTNMVENSVENRQSIMDSMASQKDGGLCVKVPVQYIKLTYLSSSSQAVDLFIHLPD